MTRDLAVDLRSNIAAEARAKIVYERLIGFTRGRGLKESFAILDDPGNHPHAGFHHQHSTAWDKPQLYIGIIKPNPTLVDQFFNASTIGESQYGEGDFVRPYNHLNGLIQVESEIKGGQGLDVTPLPHSRAPK